VSLAPHGHYDFYSGSSLATAEVSGLVALLRAQSSHLTAHDAQTLLAESVRTAPGDEHAGSPNACVALASMLHGKRCAAH
jgi:Subtilase family